MTAGRGVIVVPVVPCVSCIDLVQRHHGPLPNWFYVSLWVTLSVCVGALIVMGIFGFVGWVRDR